MAFPTIFNNLSAGSVSASLLDTMYSVVGTMGQVMCTASGTNTIALTPNTNMPTISSYSNYQLFGFVAANTSTGAVTINVSSVGALNAYDSDGTTQLSLNDIQSGWYYIFSYNSALNSSAGGFQRVSGFPVSQLRKKLTATTNYYVATTGNDSNPGTSGSPFLTIQKAINVVNALDLNGQTVNINVSDGTYTGGVAVSSPFIGGIPNLIGDVTTPANCLISTTSADAISVSNKALLNVSGFKLQTTTGGNCLDASANSVIAVNGNMTYGTCAAAHINAASSVINVNNNYTITAGAQSHWQATSGGIINADNLTITLTGTPAFASNFAIAGGLAYITTFGNTFSGSATGARYLIYLNSAISTNGSGTAYLPGNSGGSSQTGGQYA